MFVIPSRVTLLTICMVFVSSCNVQEVDEYQGYIDGDLTFLASPFSGVLQNLKVKEGDFVEKDQSLVQLDLEPQYSQHKQAIFEHTSSKKTLDNLEKGERQTVIMGIDAEIAKAKSELSLAQARLDRQKALYEKKLTDKDSLEQANNEYQTKFDTVNQLDAKLKEAKLGGREDVVSAQKALVGSFKARVDELAWAINSKKLQAPDAGYIYDIFYREGELVPNSKPILSMLSPLNQYIVFYIPLKMVEQIKKNTKVIISCEGCKHTYDAKINYVSQKVEYTPPVIFSREHQDKYVYRVHARLKQEDVFNFNLGQPVFVKLNKE